MYPLDDHVGLGVRVVPARPPKILGEQYQAGNQLWFRINDLESDGLLREIHAAGLQRPPAGNTRSLPGMATPDVWIAVTIAGSATFWASVASVIRAFIKKNDAKQVTVSTTEISITGYAQSDLAPLLETLQEQHRNLVERSIVYDKYGSVRPQEEQDEIRADVESQDAQREKLALRWAKQREQDERSESEGVAQMQEGDDGETG